MKKPTDIGMNRTGIDTSPIDSKKSVKEALQTPPTSPGSAQAIFAERALFIKAAGPTGSVPPPATLSGLAQSGVKKAKLMRPEVFIDKLSERLAFERSGVRLYEALINKCEARDLGLQETSSQQVSIQDLYRFHDAERNHFYLLYESMRTLGADPTALTPSADAVAVESLGLLQVLTDPRTSVAQSIHAVLVAELTDNDGWETLILVAEALKQKKLAHQFRGALAEEQYHLETIRKFYTNLMIEDTKAA